MKHLSIITLISQIVLILSSNSCKRDPYTPNFEHAGGYVIGKETCKSDTASDFWLVDLSYPLNNPDKNYGDTIAINGILYNHMIKTSQLPTQFKIEGKKLSFDFHLTASKMQTMGCTVSNPITYTLREMTILASGDIR